MISRYKYHTIPGSNSFAKTPDMVRFFSEKIGVRYPYAKYAQVAAHRGLKTEGVMPRNRRHDKTQKPRSYIRQATASSIMIRSTWRRMTIHLAKDSSVCRS